MYIFIYKKGYRVCKGVERYRELEFEVGFLLI